MNLATTAFLAYLAIPSGKTPIQDPLLQYSTIPSISKSASSAPTSKSLENTTSETVIVIDTEKIPRTQQDVLELQTYRESVNNALQNLKHQNPIEKHISILDTTFNIIEYRVAQKNATIEQCLNNQESMSYYRIVLLYEPAIRERYNKQLASIKEDDSIEQSLFKQDSAAFNRSIDDLLADASLRESALAQFTAKGNYDYDENYTHDRMVAEKTFASLLVIAKGKAPYFEFAKACKDYLKKNEVAENVCKMMISMQSNDVSEQELRKAATAALEEYFDIGKGLVEVKGF